MESRTRSRKRKGAKRWTGADNKGKEEAYIIYMVQCMNDMYYFLKLMYANKTNCKICWFINYILYLYNFNYTVFMSGWCICKKICNSCALSQNYVAYYFYLFSRKWCDLFYLMAKHHIVYRCQMSKPIRLLVDTCTNSMISYREQRSNEHQSPRTFVIHWDSWSIYLDMG